jgi:hypothetical protein
MMHPTCTELGSWHPADTQSAVSRHLNVCGRCRGLHARLEAERAEVERLLPTAGFLERLAAIQPRGAAGTVDSLGSERAWPEPGQADRGGSFDSRGDASAEVSGGLSSSVRSAMERLEFDAESGLVWMKLPEGRPMALGDLRELRAYLEGAWLEAWSGVGAPGSQGALTRGLQRDADAAIQHLRPRLERIGWLDAAGAAAHSPPRDSRAGGSAGWQRRVVRAALVAAPLVVVGLVLRTGLEGPGRAPEIAIAGSPSSTPSPDLVAKGAPGLPRLVVLVRRGEISLEYDDTATVLPGDRLRLRFHQQALGPLLAGIWTDSGDWVAFFEAPFGAGEHSPTATLSVDERPGSGRVLLGTPAAVRAFMSGAPSSGVSVLRLAWAPSPAGR